MDDDHPFTITEIMIIINNLNNGKAPGHHSIPAEVIKHLYNLAPDIIVNLYNYFLLIGQFPDIWKIAICKLIAKPSIKILDHPKHYRPISLLPVLGKILEKAQIDRINFHLHKNNCLHKKFGFTPQSSTTDAILMVKNLINSTFSKKNLFSNFFTYQFCF